MHRTLTHQLNRDLRRTHVARVVEVGHLAHIVEHASEIVPVHKPLPRREEVELLQHIENVQRGFDVEGLDHLRQLVHERLTNAMLARRTTLGKDIEYLTPPRDVDPAEQREEDVDERA
eukprot:3398019-Rhodomonas_salina.2